MSFFIDALNAGALLAFFQVVMIDLALAGDNAVAVGLAAAGLPADQRKKAILLGLIAAVAMRIGFALITVQLLQLVGLLLAGGLLLLWVTWKMWRELDHSDDAIEAEGEFAVEEATGAAEGEIAPPSVAKAKTMGQALLQIMIADVTMSLDNVLAVAGAAHEHPAVLVAGLLLSIALMGVVAGWIAKLLHRYRWLGYIGVAIVFGVACNMIWEGHRSVIIDTGKVGQYNEVMPRALDISPEMVAEHWAKKQAKP